MLNSATFAFRIKHNVVIMSGHILLKFAALTDGIALKVFVIQKKVFFNVHKDNGVILNFKEATKRLYYFDTAARDDQGTMLVTTVENNTINFSAYDFAQATKARDLQCRIGRPSTADFIHIVSNNLLPNCPITAQDIKNAEFIFGKDVGSLQGKTVRRRSLSACLLLSLWLAWLHWLSHKYLSLCLSLIGMSNHYPSSMPSSPSPATVMLLSLLLFLPSLLRNNDFIFCSAFRQQLSTSAHNIIRRRQYTTSATTLLVRRDDYDKLSSHNDDLDHEDATTSPNVILFAAALPPVGQSSFWNHTQNNTDDDNNVDNNNASSNINNNNNIAIVSRKFQLQYTCKICSTHNSHSISRIGYNHGVVIAICKYCNNRHLIADNLGWVSGYNSNSHAGGGGFDFEGGECNIEEYVRNRQLEKKIDDDVSSNNNSLRVGRGVFDLESSWHVEKKEDNINNNNTSRRRGGGGGRRRGDGEDWD